MPITTQAAQGKFYRRARAIKTSRISQWEQRGVQAETSAE
jgi:hypothetical protein